MTRKGQKKNLPGGELRIKLRGCWSGIKRRCLDANSKPYKWYGGRGVTICDEWKNDFEAFVSWSLSSGCKKGLTIDRVDNDGNYEPSNCRWVTQKENNRNRSDGVMLTAFGETKSVTEWSEDERCQVPRFSLFGRLSKGWSPEEAISIPKRWTTKNKITAFGETKTISEWVLDSRCSITYSALSARLSVGWDSEKAISEPRSDDPPKYSVYLTAFGETKLLLDWLKDERCKCGRVALVQRISSGWEHEKAISTPQINNTRLITAFGEIKTIAEWARDERCKVEPKTLQCRINRGWDPEKSISTPSTFDRKPKA